MKDIAIFGAGGLGREIYCLIRDINFSSSEPKWNFVGFFDDSIEKNTRIGDFGFCLGGVEELNYWADPIDICVAIGNPNSVKHVVDRVYNDNVRYPNIISPKVTFNDIDSFKIGQGNIIQSNCIFSCDVTIGNFNLFNGSVVLGHDCRMGNYNTIMPAVRISGEVSIGDFNFFGVGSIVLQQLTVRNRIRLGAGSVLMTKPKEGALYLGIPAKMMKI